MKAARKYGAAVSYDLNYRDSLWRSFGGKKKAQEINRRIAPYVDVMLGNEEDFSAALGFQVPGSNHHLSALDPEAFKRMIGKVVNDFPFKVVAKIGRASCREREYISLGRGAVVRNINL